MRSVRHNLAYRAHAYSHTLTLKHTSLSHTHKHTLTLSLSHTHKHTLTLSLSHTQTHTYTVSLSHTQTHTYTVSLSHTHSHTHRGPVQCGGDGDRCGLLVWSGDLSSTGTAAQEPRHWSARYVEYQRQGRGYRHT